MAEAIRPAVASSKSSYRCADGSSAVQAKRPTPMATTSDLGATWKERMLGAPFDLRWAPNAGGWFVGDYFGLAATSLGFTGLFVMTNPGWAENRSDVFAANADPAVATLPAVAAEQRVAPRPLAERVRGMREPGR